VIRWAEMVVWAEMVGWCGGFCVLCFVLFCCVEGFDGPFGVKPGGGKA